MKFIYAGLFVLQAISANGQHAPDSTVKIVLDEWRLAPRFGISVQRNAFAEAGFSFNQYKILYERKGRYSLSGCRLTGFYASSEIMIRGDKTIIGPKAGFEYATISHASAMSAAIEVTQYTDFRQSTLAITPRLGFSFLFAELTYGYNFLLDKDLAHYVGKHRVSLTMNLNRRYWKKHVEMSKEYHQYMSEQR